MRSIQRSRRQYFSKDRLYFSMYRTDLDTENIADPQGLHDVAQQHEVLSVQLHAYFLSQRAERIQLRPIRVQGSSRFRQGIPSPEFLTSALDRPGGVNGPWGPATFIQNTTMRDGAPGERANTRSSSDMNFGRETTTPGRGTILSSSLPVSPQFDCGWVQDDPTLETAVNFNPLSGKVAGGAYRHLLNTHGVFARRLETKRQALR